jgi:MFS family permease
MDTIPDEPDRSRVLLAKGLRAFGDGYVSLLLPAYLIELGRSPLEVGVIATVTLVGSGVLTLGVGLHAYRFHYRAVLLAAAALMAATGLGFAFITDFWPLLAIALVGTLNPSSGDVSVFLPLEHAVLSRVVPDRDRTAVFARYSLVGSLVSAFGALAAGLPAWAASTWGIGASPRCRPCSCCTRRSAARRRWCIAACPRQWNLRRASHPRPSRGRRAASTRSPPSSASTPSAGGSSSSRSSPCGSTSAMA